jgi:hypothetical protein
MSNRFGPWYASFVDKYDTLVFNILLVEILAAPRMGDLAKQSDSSEMDQRSKEARSNYFHGLSHMEPIRAPADASLEDAKSPGAAGQPRARDLDEEISEVISELKCLQDRREALENRRNVFRLYSLQPSSVSMSDPRNSTAYATATTTSVTASSTGAATAYAAAAMNPNTNSSGSACASALPATGIEIPMGPPTGPTPPCKLVAKETQASQSRSSEPQKPASK